MLLPLGEIISFSALSQNYYQSITQLLYYFLRYWGFFPPNPSSIPYHTIQRKWSQRSFHRPDTDCMSQWDFKAKG